MYQYQSEITQFLQEYLQNNPEQRSKRVENRAILWEVTLKEEDTANFKASKLPNKAYPYLTD